MKILNEKGEVLATKSVWIDKENPLLVHFVDQRFIPFKVEIITSKSPQMTAEFISSMVVRGAPAIGGAAAYGIVQSVTQHQDIKNIDEKKEKIFADAKILLQSRPTAVDMQNSISILTKKVEQIIFDEEKDLVEEIKKLAQKIVDKIINDCQLLANTGCDLVKEKMTLLHHCNTGPLATIDIGSALGVIIEAHTQGKHIHVYVDETRPRLQGARLTTWELTQAHVPHTLIVDTVSATLMKQGKIDLILVGADRIAMNGDFANKVGTYNLAILAQYHKIPIYTVAPWSTFDQSIINGSQIVIEERSAQEVTHAFSEDLQMKKISAESPVYNPAFDITPHELLTGIIAPGIIIKPPFDQTIKSALQKNNQKKIK